MTVAGSKPVMAFVNSEGNRKIHPSFRLVLLSEAGSFAADVEVMGLLTE